MCLHNLSSPCPSPPQLNVDRSNLRGPRDLVIYFSLPDSHKGQQLASYGGILHYRIHYSNIGASQTTSYPDVIIRVRRDRVQLLIPLFLSLSSFPYLPVSVF